MRPIIWDAQSYCALQIAAHASTVDLAVGFFAIPKRKVFDRDLHDLASRIPYCTTAVFRRQSSDPSSVPYGIWDYLGESALSPITYANFCSRPNKEFLLRKTKANESN